MAFDYTAYKAAFRRRALERGIDPERGLTDYQARMLELKASGHWSVEGVGRLRFYNTNPDTVRKPVAVKRDEPLRYEADDLTPRGMTAEQVVDWSPDLMPADGVSLRLLYAETKMEWEREQRHARPLKQVNADRRRFEDARALAVRGLTAS